MISFSIITPTVQRPSLLRCCHSVNEQSYPEWRHIVMIDDNHENKELTKQTTHSMRSMAICGPFRNFGNGPRRLGWEFADGDYVIYLDDDNFFSDRTSLTRIAESLLTAPEADFAIFPIWRFGHYFFNDPPGLCKTDSANIVCRREFAQWPSGDDYTMDGIWVEKMIADGRKWVGFPNVKPIISVPVQGKGERA